MKNQLSVQIDEDDQNSPGWKFAEAELQGIPIRIEVGPKDMEKNQVVLVRRDTYQKIPVAVNEAETRVRQLLEEIQNSLFHRALAFKKENTHQAEDYQSFKTLIEEQGGLVVTDSLCFGSRMLWKDVDEEADDPWTALARFYVAERPSCPRLFGEYEQRAAFVKEMIRDFKVDGVILERLAFCDLWGFEQFTIKNDFQDWDMPLLMLDREYTLSGIGQLRTRVQAFLETIGERDNGSKG